MRRKRRMRLLRLSLGVVIVGALVFTGFKTVLDNLNKEPSAAAMPAQTTVQQQVGQLAGESLAETGVEATEETTGEKLPKSGFSNELQGYLRLSEEAKVYKDASMTGEAIATMPAKTYVEVYGQDGQSFKVRSKDVSGYVEIAKLASIGDESMLKVINGLLIVNRTYGLPVDFAPGSSADALNAFEVMKESALRDDIVLKIASGYRGYDNQKEVYDSMIEAYGETNGNQLSAMPGHSEHQTGLAFDVMGEDSTARINAKFNDSKESAWLINHAYKYGFILRYPKGKEAITGFSYESWHYRYVGVEVATAIHQKNLTLEEYLGLR